jgi:hypothetical protein
MHLDSGHHIPAALAAPWRPAHDFADVAAVRVKLDDVKSVGEALQRIKDATAKKKPGEWIISDSWHPTAQLKEQRAPGCNGNENA